MTNQGICTKGSIKTIGKLSFCTCGKPNCLLGKGGFGEVYRGKFDGQVEVAVKRVDKFRTKVETGILRKADCHPNILRFYITEEKNQSKYIATELCAGNLDDLIKKRYKGPSVGYDNRIILRQIVSGLEHLHKMRIIHRDIKPENILVSFKNGYIPPVMKLTDFGLSRTALVNHFRVIIPNDGDDGIRVGTEGWMAPEMYENVKFTYSIDVFPLGCVFAFTLNDGHHPFDIDPPKENETRSETRMRIKERSVRIENKQPMMLTEEQLKEGDRIAFKLIESMLNPDPKIRPSASKILQHEYFKLSGINSIRSVQPLHNRTTVRDAQKEEEFLELCSREQMDDAAINRYNELAMDGAVYCNCTNDEGYSPLMLLCRNNTQSDNLYRSIEVLLKRPDIDVNQTDKYGDNCLMKLCWNSSSQRIAEIAELLIANGGDVNQKDQYGDNALMLLCWNSTNDRMVQVAELLITKGTDVNHEDNYGRNAFYYLQMNSNIKNLNRQSRERLQLFFSNPQPSRCFIM